MPLVKRKEDKKSKKYPELRREKKDKVSVGEKKGLQQRKNNPTILEGQVWIILRSLS